MSHRERSSSCSVKRRPDIYKPHFCREDGDTYRRRALSSPASDLAARRGVFSRRHYGSVELLINTDQEGAGENAGRFRVEVGDREGELASPLHSPVHVENPEFETRWYFKYFLGKLHQNYVGCDSSKEPFFLSVVVTDANNRSVSQYRSILWRKTGNQKICLPYNPAKSLSVKAILGHFDIDRIDKGPKEIINPEIQKDLLVFEEQEGSVNFKFGVLFARDDQTSDDEMYSNEHSSHEFEQFYSLLGERVQLRGWDKFRGGLDTKGDTTGHDAIYTVYEGHEIMFHVSTLLPYSKENKQQVERKRHIGNDIVNIIFVECDEDKVPTFKPSMMKTHFTHIYAVVTYCRSTRSYRLAVYSEETVPLFGPPLPCPPVFDDHAKFRDFLLVKLINGEKAAFNVPVFAQKRQRTMDMLIKNLYEDHMTDTAKNNMLNRRAFSDLIPENVHGSRRKEEARQLEFLRVGQSLKLKTILKGDAPTSLASSGALLKRHPWEPQCFNHDFHHDIVCGDSWGDKLILVSSNGTFVLEEGFEPQMIFDKSVLIKQLNVVEAHGLLIFRADKGKESKVHVMRLSDFDTKENEEIVRGKADLKDYKIEKSKGCSMYALSRSGGSHLRMVVALGKRLLLFVWKHCSAWSSWCPVADNDVTESFEYKRELLSFEVPHIVTLVDGTKSDNQICVGYKNQFDLINEKNGDTLQLHHVENAKTNIVSALDIYEDDEAELLLCYNHVSHFQKLREDDSHEFDFHWNSEPKAIVCAFPYIMAFTPDTIEIRLIINGNLVQTMTMPNLQLITSKCDIYFASTDSDICSCVTTRKLSAFSFVNTVNPPAGNVALSIFKIPLTCLVGTTASDRALSSPRSPQPMTFLPPFVSDPESSLTEGPAHRHAMQRSERVAQLPHDLCEQQQQQLAPLRSASRHGSSSSCSADSGILLYRHHDTSPPHSPLYMSTSSSDHHSTHI